ncbi:hypothetical protein GCM10023152_26940 [Agromyces bauzanensis]|uniref:Uncharacterized protein n=1 Tax=Agromyces bauzanensis TaxID=1308924 RepID=A0A917UV69_9MICO|nr:hypothetical protein GCM10011372_26920 [Agromyces bauzanensis]
MTEGFQPPVTAVFRACVVRAASDDRRSALEGIAQLDPRHAQAVIEILGPERPARPAILLSKPNELA